MSDHLSDRAAREIANGANVELGMQLGVDPTNGWHILSMPVKEWEHFIAAHIPHANDCPRCQEHLQALVEGFGMRWVHEPDGWILRFPTT